MLKIGNYFGHRRLGHAELYGCLGHAALLNNRVKYMQVAQPQAPADLTLPVDFSQHRYILISIETNREFPYIAAGLLLQST